LIPSSPSPPFSPSLCNPHSPPLLSFPSPFPDAPLNWCPSPRSKK
jgi:hypothetical protein